MPIADPLVRSHSFASERGGAGPASLTGKPIGTYTVAGHKWTLFKGLVGTWDVFVASFPFLSLFFLGSDQQIDHADALHMLLYVYCSWSYVTAEGDITNFSADLKLFFSSSIFPLFPSLPPFLPFS
jgi:hypothetical protein